MNRTAEVSASQDWLHPRSRAGRWALEGGIALSASLFVAVCARFGSLPLPFTPVPLSMQNFAVLLVGLALGSRRGATALAAYLAEGALGAPVFAPMRAAGMAHLLGPTGGFLLAYPLVALVAGWLFEHGRKTFWRAVFAATVAEVVLFAGGVTWLMLFTRSASAAMQFGLYPFFFAEVMKVMLAAGIASQRRLVLGA